MLIFILANVFQKPHLNVITKNEVTNEISYIAISSKSKSKNISEFKSDEISIYTANSDWFIDDTLNNKFTNSLNETMLKDSNWDILKDYDLVKEIFKAAEIIDHDIFQLDIIKTKTDYFVLIKLNVNWQSLNDFYRYEKTNNKLEFLHRFDAQDITGIAYP
ncbi:MAG: hypothetical protein GX769_02595 [Erysipelothrix sp.]|nr:hypothetical protein [Erysipelothrix sp.]